MRRSLLLVLLCIPAAAMAESSAPVSPIVLAGEHVRFDAAMHPWFTERQIRNSSAATREGLALWAATESGRETLTRLSGAQYEVDVVEDVEQPARGGRRNRRCRLCSLHSIPRSTRVMRSY
jgi:hypothetical protein